MSKHCTRKNNQAGVFFLVMSIYLIVMAGLIIAALAFGLPL